MTNMQDKYRLAERYRAMREMLRGYARGCTRLGSADLVLPRE